MGAGRRLLVPVHNELLENVAAHGAGIFKDRHGLFGIFLGFNCTTFLIVIPRRGSAAHRSREAGNSRDAGKDEKPEDQETSVKQNKLHKTIIHPRGARTSYSGLRRAKLCGRGFAVNSRSPNRPDASGRNLAGGNSPPSSDGRMMLSVHWHSERRPQRFPNLKFVVKADLLGAG